MTELTVDKEAVEEALDGNIYIGDLVRAYLLQEGVDLADGDENEPFEWARIESLEVKFGGGGTHSWDLRTANLRVSDIDYTLYREE